MITKNEAIWLLKKAMEYGMTYTDGKYQHHQMVTMNANGYWVIPINRGAGFTIELAYKSVFSWVGSPDELKEIGNGI
jgi:predicted CoA-binding protein